MWETWVWSLDWEDPLEEGMATPLQYSCLENSHGQRSLEGCSPWGLKESGTTERFHFHFHFHALEKEMATHSSTIAWKISWTEKPGELQSMGSQSWAQLSD